jgi:hypothetical protein
MNHLKLFLNISTNFHPGFQTIGDYLINRGKELIQLGEQMNRDNSDNLEETIKKDPESHWETEGSY